MKTATKQEQRKRRHIRSRARMSGTPERPRFVIYRSLRGMYAQLIDDIAGVTLVSVHSKKDVDTKADAGERKGKVAQSYLLGKTLAQKALDKGIKAVVFDRAGFRYHGRVQAIADGAREGGLEF